VRDSGASTSCQCVGLEYDRVTKIGEQDPRYDRARWRQTTWRCPRRRPDSEALESAICRPAVLRHEARWLHEFRIRPQQWLSRSPRNRVDQGGRQSSCRQPFQSRWHSAQDLFTSNPPARQAYAEFHWVIFNAVMTWSWDLDRRDSATMSAKAIDH